MLSVRVDKEENDMLPEFARRFLSQAHRLNSRVPKPEEDYYDEFTCGDCAHYIPADQRDGEGYACTLSHPWASAQRVACEDFEEQA
jgi:hypothetical protein